jgi:hypothetical protein
MQQGDFQDKIIYRDLLLTTFNWMASMCYYFGAHLKYEVQMNATYTIDFL